MLKLLLLLLLELLLLLHLRLGRVVLAAALLSVVHHGVLVEGDVVLVEEVVDVHDGELGVVQVGQADRLVPQLGAQESRLRVRGVDHGLAILKRRGETMQFIQTIIC